MKIYHGTSLDIAQSIKKRGFHKVNKHNIGLSSTRFFDKATFFTTTKSGAMWYATQNIRYKEPAIIICDYNPGKIFDYGRKQTDDLYVFDHISKEFNVPYVTGTTLDLEEIQKTLLSKGYTVVKFRDKRVNGLSVLLVLDPQNVKVIEVKSLPE